MIKQTMAICVIILLFINLYAIGTGQISFENKTDGTIGIEEPWEKGKTENILEYLDDIDESGILDYYDYTKDDILDDMQITEDWGTFNGFRDFLNSIGRFIGIIAFMASKVFYALSFTIVLITGYLIP